MSNGSAPPLASSPQEAVGWECSQPPGQSIGKAFEKHSVAYSTAGGALSGFDLVTRVLDHPDGGDRSLIELAGGAETDWLEFRAAMGGRPEDSKNPNNNDAYSYWSSSCWSGRFWPHSLGRQATNPYRGLDLSESNSGHSRSRSGLPRTSNQTLNPQSEISGARYHYEN